MKHCTNCGAELEQNGRFCPSCGASVDETPTAQEPLTEQPVYSSSEPVYSAPNAQQTVYAQPSAPKKHSTMSIWALICSILCCQTVGLILAIVDLSKSKQDTEHKHTLSIVALVLSIVLSIVGAIGTLYAQKLNSEDVQDEIVSAVTDNLIGDDDDTQETGTADITVDATTVCSNEDLTITITGLRETSDEYILTMDVDNRSSRDLRVSFYGEDSFPGIAINGIVFNGYPTTPEDIKANEHNTDYQLSLNKEDLEEDHIEVLGSMAGCFSLFDTETYETLYFTDQFNIVFDDQYTQPKETGGVELYADEYCRIVALNTAYTRYGGTCINFYMESYSDEAVILFGDEVYINDTEVDSAFFSATALPGTGTYFRADPWLFADDEDEQLSPMDINRLDFELTVYTGDKTLIDEEGYYVTFE